MDRYKFDLNDLYRRAFGIDPQRYRVDQKTDINEDGTNLNNSSEGQYNRDGTIKYDYANTEAGKYKIRSRSADSGSTIWEQYNGKDIWLPTRFRHTGLGTEVADVNGDILLPYTVVKITGKKTIVKTPLSERGGTVKELYSIDDYVISIKGFLIDENNRVWPDKEIKQLKQLFCINTAIELDNALTNQFLHTDNNINNRVVIDSFELPEVEGGSVHIRPFSMTLESDSVFDLYVDHKA